MTNIRALTQSLAVLSLAGLVAAAPAARAGSAATAAHSAKSPAAAPASTSSRRVRTVLLSRTGLTRVRLSGGIYTWSMTAVARHSSSRRCDTHFEHGWDRNYRLDGDSSVNMVAIVTVR